jgi:hypothetical protein
MSNVAGPDQAPDGALLGGEITVGNVLPLGRADGLTLNNPVNPVLDLTLSLPYMGSVGVDQNAVVQQVQEAVATFVSGYSTNAVLEATQVAEIAEAVPGCLRCACYFGGAASVDPTTGQWNEEAGTFVGSGTEPYFLTPASVRVRTVAISPTNTLADF